MQDLVTSQVLRTVLASGWYCIFFLMNPRQMTICLFKIYCKYKKSQNEPIEAIIFKTTRGAYAKFS